MAHRLRHENNLENLQNPYSWVLPPVSDSAALGSGPENLHFYQAPRWYWCCWPTEHTLRAAASSLLRLSAKIKWGEPLPHKKHETATLRGHWGITICPIHCPCFPGNTIRIFWMKYPPCTATESGKGRRQGLPTSISGEAPLSWGSGNYCKHHRVELRAGETKIGSDSINWAWSSIYWKWSGVIKNSQLESSWWTLCIKESPEEARKVSVNF